MTPDLEYMYSKMKMLSELSISVFVQTNPIVKFKAYALLRVMTRDLAYMCSAMKMLSEVSISLFCK